MPPSSPSFLNSHNATRAGCARVNSRSLRRNSPAQYAYVVCICVICMVGLCMCRRRIVCVAGRMRARATPRVPYNLMCRCDRQYRETADVWGSGKKTFPIIFIRLVCRIEAFLYGQTFDFCRPTCVKFKVNILSSSVQRKHFQ